jgi:tetratricopeptide (TPR) repeat protein
MDSPPARAARIDAHWDFDDPARSERAFRSLLAQAEDDAERVQILSQVARAVGLQRRFEEAHALLDQAEAILGAAAGLERVRLLLERGRVLNSSRQAERARPLFLQALELAVAAGADFYAVDAAHMLGIVDPGDAGRAWNQRALELAQASADERAGRWAGSLCNNLGWSHHAEGRYAEAMRFFERALAERRRRGTPGERRVARWCVARCLRSLGDATRALEQQRALLRESPDAPDGYVHEEIAECLAALGRPAEAGPHFATAYAILRQDPWLAEQEPQRLERLRDRGLEPRDAARG